jgi:hypothetical protein
MVSPAAPRGIQTRFFSFVTQVQPADGADDPMFVTDFKGRRGALTAGERTVAKYFEDDHAHWAGSKIVSSGNGGRERRETPCRMCAVWVCGMAKPKTLFKKLMVNASMIKMIAEELKRIPGGVHTAADYEINISVNPQPRFSVKTIQWGTDYSLHPDQPTCTIYVTDPPLHISRRLSYLPYELQAVERPSFSTVSMWFTTTDGKLYAMQRQRGHTYMLVMRLPTDGVVVRVATTHWHIMALTDAGTLYAFKRQTQWRPMYPMPPDLCARTFNGVTSFACTRNVMIAITAADPTPQVYIATSSTDIVHTATALWTLDWKNVVESFVAEHGRIVDVAGSNAALMASTAAGAVLEIDLTDYSIKTVRRLQLGAGVELRSLRCAVMALGRHDWRICVSDVVGYYAPHFMGGGFQPDFTHLTASVMPPSVEMIKLGPHVPLCKTLAMGRMGFYQFAGLPPDANAILRDLEQRRVNTVVSGKSITFFEHVDGPFIGTVLRTVEDKDPEVVKHPQVPATWQLHADLIDGATWKCIKFNMLPAGVYCRTLKVIDHLGHVVCGNADCDVHPLKM